MLLVLPRDEDVAPVRKPVAGFEDCYAAVYRLVDEKGDLRSTLNDRLHLFGVPAVGAV